MGSSLQVPASRYTYPNLTQHHVHLTANLDMLVPGNARTGGPASNPDRAGTEQYVGFALAEMRCRIFQPAREVLSLDRKYIAYQTQIIDFPCSLETPFRQLGWEIGVLGRARPLTAHEAYRRRYVLRVACKSIHQGNSGQISHRPCINVSIALSPKLPTLLKTGGQVRGTKDWTVF
jgi:hypothetical protein